MAFVAQLGRKNSVKLGKIEKPISVLNPSRKEKEPLRFGEKKNTVKLGKIGVFEEVKSELEEKKTQ